VNNVNITRIHNTYRTTVINNTNINRVSYNGGKGGINARASSAELVANRDRHIAVTSLQVQHEHAARADRAQFASVNKGRPTVAATARPGKFSGSGALAATAASPRATNTGANANRSSSFGRSTSNVNPSGATSNRGRTATNNNAIQNRNVGRDNAFARSQNNPTRAKGSSNNNQSFATRTPSNTARQFNTQRSINNTQTKPRQSASRPSYSAPAQRNNVTRSQPSPAFRQNTSHAVSQAPSRQYAAPRQLAAPSYSSRQSVPQRASAPRQQSTPQRSAPQRQPPADSRTASGNGGNHGRRAANR